MREVRNLRVDLSSPWALSSGTHYIEPEFTVSPQYSRPLTGPLAWATGILYASDARDIRISGGKLIGWDKYHPEWWRLDARGQLSHPLASVSGVHVRGGREIVIDGMKVIGVPMSAVRLTAVQRSTFRHMTIRRAFHGIDFDHHPHSGEQCFGNEILDLVGGDLWCDRQVGGPPIDARNIVRSVSGALHASGQGGDLVAGTCPHLDIDGLTCTGDATTSVKVAGYKVRLRDIHAASVFLPGVVESNLAIKEWPETHRSSHNSLEDSAIIQEGVSSRSQYLLTASYPNTRDEWTLVRNTVFAVTPGATNVQGVPMRLAGITDQRVRFEGCRFVGWKSWDDLFTFGGSGQVNDDLREVNSFDEN